MEVFDETIKYVFFSSFALAFVCLFHVMEDSEGCTPLSHFLKVYVDSLQFVVILSHGVPDRRRSG